MNAAQWRQRPRNTTHPTIGILSQGRRNVPHDAQCGGGETIDSPRDTRSITTETSEPTTAPIAMQVAKAITALPRARAS